MKFKKKLIYYATVFLCIVVTIAACEKENPVSNPDEVENRDENSTETSLSNTKHPLPIDTSLYAYHAYDFYGDKFYFNQNVPNYGSVSSNYIAYEGVWECYYGEFDFALIYEKTTKTLSGTVFYYNDQVMLYHMKWQYTNYFTGSYQWPRIINYTNKNRFMRFTFTKGSLPDMNNKGGEEIKPDDMPQPEHPRDYFGE